MNSQKMPKTDRLDHHHLQWLSKFQLEWLSNILSEDFSYTSIIKIAENLYRESLSEIGKCNILIIGKTGVGKSTLINAVFREPLAKTGVGEPVTQDIRKYSKKDFPLTVYDTPGLEIDGEQIKRVTEDVSKLIDENILNEKDQIHIIWYCINHNSNRLEKPEEEWLKSLSSQHNIPVILVVTQVWDAEEDSEFLTYLKSKNLPVRQIIPILAEPKKKNSRPTMPAHGLDNLVKVTFELIPEVAQNAFVNASKSIELKAHKASLYVAGYVTAAGGIGASPIPWSDAPLLAGAQIAMLVHITAIFGLPFDKSFISAIVSSLAGTGGATLLGRAIVSNLLKMIPGVGTVAGALISSGTASMLTLALGLGYIEALKRYMKAQLKGEVMSLADLSKIISEEFKDYLKSRRQKLKGDDSDQGPTNIPIS